SEGMLCSAQELGLPWSTDGIVLLEPRDGVTPGVPASTALGCDDIVLTLGITPNRPDALCHLGVAREVAATLRTRIRAAVPGCPRYACRVIEGVVVGPSPMWLVSRLAACGVRSINNVVDVTNLVMMERGIPLHAFDCDAIAREKNRAAIVVRSARAAETILTL